MSVEENMQHPPFPHNGASVKTASNRISAFIRSFTMVIFVAMAMAVVGLIMKFIAMPAGNYVFVFAMAVLALLFLVQIGLSFFYVISNVRLALLGSICSVALVLGFVALIFKFQDWYGWQVTFFIALPIFLVTAYFMLSYFKKRHSLQKQHRIFLYRNLIFPYLFIFILGLISAFAGQRLIDQQPIHKLQNSPVDNDTASDTSGMWRAY